jgi:hypothetical protein
MEISKKDVTSTYVLHPCIILKMFLISGFSETLGSQVTKWKYYINNSISQTGELLWTDGVYIQIQESKLRIAKWIELGTRKWERIANLHSTSWYLRAFTSSIHTFLFHVRKWNGTKTLQSNVMISHSIELFFQLMCNSTLATLKDYRDCQEPTWYHWGSWHHYMWCHLDIHNLRPPIITKRIFLMGVVKRSWSELG